MAYFNWTICNNRVEIGAETPAIGDDSLRRVTEVPMGEAAHGAVNAYGQVYDGFDWVEYSDYQKSFEAITLRTDMKVYGR
jgi:hypothetical protein